MYIYKIQVNTSIGVQNLYHKGPIWEACRLAVEINGRMFNILSGMEYFNPQLVYDITQAYD